MKYSCSVEGYTSPAPPAVFTLPYQNEFWRDGLWGQCTWYACGRATEVFGIAPRFSTKPRHAGLWLGIVGNYERLFGSLVAPSIAVFQKPGTNGHVAFVESIDSGLVRYTEANWGKRFTGAEADVGGGWDLELHEDTERAFRLRGGYALVGCLRFPACRRFLGPHSPRHFA